VAFGIKSLFFFSINCLWKWDF